MAKSKEPKEKKHIQEKKMKKEIAFKLLEKDLAEFGTRFAKLNGAYGEIERQFSKVKKDYQGRMEAIELEINQIAKFIRDGERRETVDVIEKRDYNKRLVAIIHKGKEIESRDMTHEELQMELNPVGATPKIPKNLEPKTRTVRDPSTGETSEVAEVHSLETRRATKKSPLDTKSPPVN